MILFLMLQQHVLAHISFGFCLSVLLNFGFISLKSFLLLQQLFLQ